MLAVWLMLGLFLASCGGGGGGGSAPGGATVGAPSNLTATFDAATNSVTLNWTPGVGSVDGYDVEGSMNGSAFEQLNAAPLPADAVGAVLSISQQVVEGTQGSFRVRAIKGSSFSDYSNVASVTAPPSPVTWVNAAFMPGMPCNVTVAFRSASRIADHVLIERATLDAGGNVVGLWSKIASCPVAGIPLLATSGGTFQDTAVQELQSYAYRASTVCGDLASAPAGPTAPMAVPPFPPVQITATPGVSGVTLNWTIVSKVATQIQVSRAPVFADPLTAQTIATLGAGVTTLQDAALTLGTYSYFVNSLAGSTVGPSLSVVSGPLNPPGSPILTGTSFPGAGSAFGSAKLAADLSGEGLWAEGIVDDQADTVSVPNQTGFPWPSWSPAAPEGSTLQATWTFFRLDKLGLAHALYYSATNVGNGPFTWSHAWFDGSSWQTESIYPDNASTLAYNQSWAMDGAGEPHLIQANNGDGSSRYEHVFRTASGWVQEGIDTPQNMPDMAFFSNLFIDGSNNPHLLSNDSLHNTYEYTRNPDGTWSSQQVVLPGTPSLPYAMYGVWADPENAWGLYNMPNPADASLTDVWAAQKAGGTWQAPVLLHAGVPQLVGAGLQPPAQSPDGTRVAALVVDLGGLFLYTHGADGWVTTMLPVAYGGTLPGFVMVGFDASNHLHVNFGTYDLHE